MSLWERLRSELELGSRVKLGDILEKKKNQWTLKTESWVREVQSQGNLKFMASGANHWPADSRRRWRHGGVTDVWCSRLLSVERAGIAMWLPTTFILSFSVLSQVQPRSFCPLDDHLPMRFLSWWYRVSTSQLPPDPTAVDFAVCLNFKDARGVSSRFSCFWGNVPNEQQQDSHLRREIKAQSSTLCCLEGLPSLPASPFEERGRV